MGPDTEHLIAQARGGDASAYQDLFERESGRLQVYVSLRLGQRLRARVDPLDVVQDVLLSAHRGFPTFEARGPGAFRAWLHAIADHRIRDLASREGRDPTSESEQSASPGPATLVGGEEQRQRLVAALERLPAGQREVLLMRYFQGLSPADLGPALGCTPRHARRILAEAHGALAVELRRDESPGGAARGDPERDEACVVEALAALDRPEAARPLARVGPYEVREVLGSGGLSTVYRVLHPELKREVALKLLRCEAGPARARLGREVRALTRLSHPNVVKVHGAGEHEGAPYLLLDLVEGESLEEHLARHGPMPLASAVRVAWRLALALEHAHERGVLHRDVKPANVILLPDGSPVLTDFSLAKLLDTGTQLLTARGQRLGTLGFWPPEQASGQGELLGPAADVYALGATLWAMLVGQAPFVRERLADQILATLQEPARAPSELRPEVDPLLDQITLHCLEKDPARRFPSAGAVALALSCWVPQG